MIFIESGQPRRGEVRKCEICRKDFVRRVNGHVSRGKLTKKKYCSRACSVAARINKVTLRCFACNKEFLRTPSDLKVVRHGLYFCSRECKEFSQSLIGKCPEIRPSHYGSKNTYRNSLTDALVEQGCVDCSTKTRYMLSIHHIDGNRSNNIQSNLEVVCFNDHAKRHLKLVEGHWIYCLSALTPREMLKHL